MSKVKLNCRKLSPAMAVYKHRLGDLMLVSQLLSTDTRSVIRDMHDRDPFYVDDTEKGVINALTNRWRDEIDEARIGR